MPGILYAIPTPLGGAAADALPASALATVRSLRHFVVENARSARAFLKEAGVPCAIQELDISVLESEISKHIKKLQKDISIGLLSEAGCPAIADPGAALVAAAHAEGFRVIPLVGPSAVLLALMASGLEGQRFALCGYLPRERQARAERIRALERRSRAERETQIFIETPYRSEALLEALLESCEGTSRLCVAADLTLPSEAIAIRTVAQWRKAARSIGRRPAVFLLQA